MTPSPSPDVDVDVDALAAEAAELDGYFSEADLDPENYVNYPPLNESFDDTTVVITNLPRVGAAKLEKLSKVVTKLVGRIGQLAASEATGYSGVYLPLDDAAQTTLGFVLVEYTTAEEAKQAVEVLQGYKFDKNHSLTVLPYGRARQLSSVATAEFQEPEPAPFRERPNTSQWLEDGLQRDQFVVRHGKETVVKWSDGKTEPLVDYDGAREKEAGVAWCEYYTAWSPQGSYLATLVPAKGVILWGGKDFAKIGRFPAPGVEFVVFSPQENYLLTCNNSRDDPNAIKVFHTATGKLLRAFPLYPKDFLTPTQDRAGEAQQQPPPPPPFQWSHDEKYLARMGRDLVSIYEAPTFKLLDKRSLIADGIHEFQFSPKANVLAYWAPEHGNAPAHVDIIELPSRKKLRQKNLFNVTTCSMVWQNDGDYLGVKVTRHTKSKKTLFNNMELFRLNDPGIPVEMLEVKDAIMAFSWEPSGSRFAMIHAENVNSTKVDVSFYDMVKKVEAETKKSLKQAKAKNRDHIQKSIGGQKNDQLVAETIKIETLTGKQCNCVFWSPAGANIILASLGESASGTLEFYDVDNKSLTVKEHYRANQVLWDPSGRTVATVVSQPIGGGHFKFAMDNGYHLWSFQGKQLHQESFETFYQLSWRPREKLLTKDETFAVIQNLKKYEKQFDKADRDRVKADHLEKTKEKRALRSRFRERLARLKEWKASQREMAIELYGGFDPDDPRNYAEKEHHVETILSSKEEVVY